MSYTTNLPTELFVRRLRVLPVADGETDLRKKAAFLSELVSLGYEPQETSVYNDSVLSNHSLIIETLTKLKAGHVSYVPLFSGFPNDVPDEDEYLTRRILGFFGNYIGLFSVGTELENGMVIPEWLFDLEKFGADPITQIQTKELFEKGKANQEAREADTSKSLSAIKFVTADEAVALGRKYLQNILYANSSVKETLKEDIEALLNFYGAGAVDGSKVTFKETKSYLMKFFWDRGDLDAVSALTTAPTDLLRLFAALTDGDISLATKIKFPKFTRAQRKMIVATLDRFRWLEEDLVRYRGLWLAVGKSLHVGSYAKKFPNAASAFDGLRNADSLGTWNSAVEQHMVEPVFKDLLALLSERPGEFARRLHHTLRLSAHGRTQTRVLNAFAQVAEKVSLKNLFVLERYFVSFDAEQNRTVINKKGRIRVLENTLPDLSEPTRKKTLDVIQKAILAKISSEKDSWSDQKVWIDPALKTFVAPLAQRKASEAFLSAGRGTRMPIDSSKVLRLFVYWKEATRRTDLDLSLVSYDEEMNYMGHVSYTRLSGDGIVHSGDIQSAPHGAAEFIDVKLDQVRSGGVRYIAPQVYRFSGNSFDEMDECYAGWMTREKVNKAYKSFDIKTVENAFSLNGSAAYALPIIVDLETSEVIYTDLYVGSQPRHNNVENSLTSLTTITREIARFVETKPNVFDIATHHCVARNAETVQNREEADYTIGVTGCDLNATDTEAVLSALVS